MHSKYKNTALAEAYNFPQNIYDVTTYYLNALSVPSSR